MKHAPEFLKLVESVMPRIREISTQEVHEMIKQQEASRPTSPEPSAMRAPAGAQRAHFIVIDVREDHEWAKAHIPGAVHLGRGVIERDIENAVADKNTKLVLYCGGGYRSALAADNLQAMGYRNVLSMAGGWREWNEKGFPTE